MAYPTRSCPPLGTLAWVLGLVEYIQIAFFSALRVFAIWDRSYSWSLVVFTLSMAPFATNLYQVVKSKYASVMDPLAGTTCIQERMFSMRMVGIRMFHVMYITRGSLVLADTIVLVLTWIKTFGHWKNARRLKMKVSLTTCLLRDGTMYFIALLAVNIAQILTYDSSGGISPMTMFVASLPSLFINRFIINLRAAGSETSDYSLHIGGRQQGQSTLQFRRQTDRLGNIGGTLQDVWGDEPCDEEDDAGRVDEERRRETGAEA
ncbi:uncharacterized protein PHACADRAFT_201110 [Phanerochaete carnosa HHB-10118-sp]|uniref:Uncharacterized protein n=1 Tax=Phanerochaete carnosa (strain HHB-10118-sp) TaxID=650164 RepID=K5UKU3_PHACS|nr:uncharacterized protein PHACADRAFT_201110 [Phanerochaete carnosa HHB-10118-sp]EKM50266.1 hypothetical protein PHACADRAFT_201110 [Phanerochaete carnosa HHB-10118-sp]